MLELHVPWPPIACSPNASGHPVAKTRAKRRYRRETSSIAFPLDRLPDGLLVCSLVFHPPDKRRRDLDNMSASFKAALDGIFDANARDDSDIKALMVSWGSVLRPYGIVEVRIGALSEWRAVIAPSLTDPSELDIRRT